MRTMEVVFILRSCSSNNKCFFSNLTLSILCTCLYKLIFLFSILYVRHEKGNKRIKAFKDKCYTRDSAHHTRRNVSTASLSPQWLITIQCGSWYSERKHKWVTKLSSRLFEVVPVETELLSVGCEGWDIHCTVGMIAVQWKTNVTRTLKATIYARSQSSFLDARLLKRTTIQRHTWLY
jgi:hypothetical protein